MDGQQHQLQQLTFELQQPAGRRRPRRLLVRTAATAAAGSSSNGAAALPIVLASSSSSSISKRSSSGQEQQRRSSASRRQQQPLCFASVSGAALATSGGGAGGMASSSGSSGSGARPMPQFLLASAAEAPAQRGGGGGSGTPAWRLVAANLTAGAAAGCCVEAALYPIDTVKTRLQAMIGGGGLKALLSSGGGRALYAGVWGNLAGVAPSSAIFMAVYEPVKHWVYGRTEEDRHWLGPVLAGAAAGAAASLTRVPTEVVKQRLQTGEFKGAVAALRAIAAKEGLRGLYAGYGAFLLRDLPFDAIEFVAYEQLRRAAARVLQRDPNPVEVSLVGAVAGGFTGIVTTPLDVLKTRLMTQGTSGRYKNLVDATLTIARTEGLGAFMAGWQPRLIWISLGGFVFFPALEAALKFTRGVAAAGSTTPTDSGFVIAELEAEEERLLAAQRKKKQQQQQGK